MNENKREGAFIPCGDAMEKMEEILDDELENVSGGAANTLLVHCPEDISGVMVDPEPRRV